MNKKLLKVTHGSSDENLIRARDNSLVLADIATMKYVVNEFRHEMIDTSEDEEELILVFHVSIIWPNTLLSLQPSIKVAIKLKEEEQEHEVASWERVIHNSEKRGWEHTLALIMHAVRELKLDYFIMENIDSQELTAGWIQ